MSWDEPGALGLWTCYKKCERPDQKDLQIFSRDRQYGTGKEQGPTLTRLQRLSQDGKSTCLWVHHASICPGIGIDTQQEEKRKRGKHEPPEMDIVNFVNFTTAPRNHSPDPRTGQKRKKRSTC